MKPHQWHTLYRSFVLNIIIATSCLSSIQSYAQEWIIVTSEADSGVGTLRDAITQVNTGGSNSPNAIAFANNIQTIILQSNLPIITEPVLIDGLAVANLANPQDTVEGDCSLLPSPVDAPEIFSSSIRVTIDGSNIPRVIDPDSRWGLRIDTFGTIRGIRTQNISSPGNNSQAVGIFFNDRSNTLKLVECCEVKETQNTASAFSTYNRNRAVGIEDGASSNNVSVSKCYIHTIEGGSIANCDDLIADLKSGNAYGILNCTVIDNCRVECIASGSIAALCEANLRTSVGRSAGIAFAITSPGSPNIWPCNDEENRTTRAGIDNCPIACDQECSQNSACIRNNLVSDIYGGSVVTGLSPEIILTETAGIMLGSPLNSSDQVFIDTLVQNNTIKSVCSGNVTASSDEVISIILGAFGILVNAANSAQVETNCNTIESIKTGLTTLEGENSSAFPGYTYGIWNTTNDISTASATCNAISHICGATATTTGLCSILTDNVNQACGIEETRHTPGATSCADTQKPIVAGIIIEDSGLSSLYSLNNNSVQKVSGGKRVAQGDQSSVHALGTAGIYLFTASSETVNCNENNITSIIGTELIAQPGSLSAIKEDGTTGLCIFARNLITRENNIDLVCEGRIKAAHQSFGANLTNIFFGLLGKSHLYITKQLDTDTAQPYAPVITSGIVISNPGNIPTLFRTCADTDPWCIADNTVNNVIGSAVTGGLQPLGSIAVGIWIQPIANQNTRDARSFESCASIRQNNITNGTAFNNTVRNVTGGTQAPAYGIFLDGSAQFFTAFIDNERRESTFFTLDANTITNLVGSKMLPVFTTELQKLLGICPGSTPEDQEKTAFPFLPFEPPSGIYTLFGGCSTLSNNTIKEIKAYKTDARGITTAASSDMLITENSCSEIKGYGIFVGGAIATIDLAGELGTNPNDLTFESFASVRNKIHTNSTVNNTNKGIKLGLVDWSNALFGIDELNVCPIEFFSRSRYDASEVPEDSIAIFGNHGQPEPSITKVICNSNGTVTIEIDLHNTHPLTDFVIQFFRNSSDVVPHGEQAISSFNDATLVFATDFNGRAQKRFTFIPLAKIQSGDSITAHVTVNDHGQGATTDTYFCDTSEFGGQTSGVNCNPKILSPQPHNKPSTASGFAALLNR